MGKLQDNYLSMSEKTFKEAGIYSQTEDTLCRYLAYRDLPGLIKKHVKGKKTLDYGSGTGISTRFLIEQGFDVQGVDVSQAMIEQAKKFCPLAQFERVKEGQLPFDEHSFDFVFSSFVLFEIGDIEKIVDYLAAGRRLLKEDGTFIVVTGSESMYTGDFLVMQTDFPENKGASSGDRVKIYLPDVDIEFTDYYWSGKDYNNGFKKAGLKVKEVHFPLGQKDEPWDWKDESIRSPFIIYVMDAM